MLNKRAVAITLAIGVALILLVNTIEPIFGWPWDSPKEDKPKCDLLFDGTYLKVSRYIDISCFEYFDELNNNPRYGCSEIDVVPYTGHTDSSYIVWNFRSC